MLTRPRRARCGRRSVRACVARRYVLYTELSITYNDQRRCSLPLCNLLEINTILRLFITEMVTRSALLVATPKPKVWF